MNQSTGTVLVIAFLSLLAVFVTVASILILRGGKFYHRIPAKSRPRRWFVAIFFSYFVLFCLWFPVWMFYPRSMFSRIFGFRFQRNLPSAAIMTDRTPYHFVRAAWSSELVHPGVGWRYVGKSRRGNSPIM